MLRFELRLSSRDLLREFFNCAVAQVRKLLDVHRIKIDLCHLFPLFPKFVMREAPLHELRKRKGYAMIVNDPGAAHN